MVSQSQPTFAQNSAILELEVKSMEVKISNYGQLRDVNATDGEKEIFNVIMEILADEGIDTSKFGLVRKSDNYVTVALLLEDPGQLDLARIKFTPRAKWIWTSYDGKVKIHDPEDVRDYADAFLNDYQQHIDWLEESYPELLK